MFGHRYFGAPYFGPRYFGGNGTITVVQPEPEPPVVVGSSGGNLGRPRSHPLLLQKPLVCEIVSGQGSQSVKGQLSFRLSALLRADSAEQRSTAELGLALEVSNASRQAQFVKGDLWPSMRATVSADQVSQKTIANGSLSLDLNIKSGVAAQKAPTYSGKPLPRIFMQ